MDYTFLDQIHCHYLTNSFVPLLLIKLLSSITSIVRIADDTSPLTRTISYTVTGKGQVRNNILEDQIFLQTRVIGSGGMKKMCAKGEEKNVPRWGKEGMHQKRLGTTDLAALSHVYATPRVKLNQ